MLPVENFGETMIFVLMNRSPIINNVQAVDRERWEDLGISTIGNISAFGGSYNSPTQTVYRNFCWIYLSPR